MTQYALVTEDGVEEAELPGAAKRLVDGRPTGEWVLGLDDTRTSDAVRAECGYFPIEEDDRPPCKSNQYLESELVVRYGLPVREWKRRIKPLEDQVKETRQALKKKEVEEIKAVIKGVDDFLEKEKPSLVDIREQLKGLARTVKLLAQERLEV